MSGKITLNNFRDGNPEKTLKLLTNRKYIYIAIAIFFVSMFVFGPGSFMLAFFYIIMIFGLREAIKHKSFMKQFALDNNLKFKDSINTNNLIGRLFNIGRLKNATSVVFGKHNDFPFQIFNYRYTVGSGKNSQTYKFTICEITIKDVLFPHIFLKSDSMRRYHVMDLFGLDKDTRIKLEGDLEKYFNLYCTQDYEIEVLQIFTIDFLNLLKEKGSHLSIEFSEDKIYIYDDLVIKNKKDLDQFYSIVKYFIDKKGQLLHRLKDDLDAMHSSYRK